MNSNGNGYRIDLHPVGGDSVARRMYREQQEQKSLIRSRARAAKAELTREATTDRTAGFQVYDYLKSYAYDVNLQCAVVAVSDSATVTLN